MRPDGQALPVALGEVSRDPVSPSLQNCQLHKAFRNRLGLGLGSSASLCLRPVAYAGEEEMVSRPRGALDGEVRFTDLATAFSICDGENEAGATDKPRSCVTARPGGRGSRRAQCVCHLCPAPLSGCKLHTL